MSLSTKFEKKKRGIKKFTSITDNITISSDRITKTVDGFRPPENFL